MIKFAKPILNKTKRLLNNRSRYTILPLLILLFSKLIFCEEIFVLNSKIGATLDLEENIYYKVFPEIDNFINAQFYDDNGLKVRIKKISNNGIIYENRNIGYLNFRTLSREIDKRKPFTEELRQKILLSNKRQFSNCLVSEINKNTICQIRTKDFRWVLGTFQSITPKGMYLWQNDQIVSVPVDIISKINYYNDYQQPDKLNKYILVGCSALGWILAGRISDFISIEDDRKYLFQSTSFCLASVYGYKNNKGIDRLFSPGFKLNLIKNKKSDNFVLLFKKKYVKLKKLLNENFLNLND